MFRPIKKPLSTSCRPQNRSIHHIKQKPESPESRPRIPQRSREERKMRRTTVEEAVPNSFAKRNEVGVQLLSRQLHEQIFKNVSVPRPCPRAVQISKEHLDLHDLDPSQGSILPNTGFVLPPLQGDNLDEHFYRIGSHAADPWLRLAKEFASAQLPPKPDCWDIQVGWIKYFYRPDGSSYSEHVPYPNHDGKDEEMLVFDVETLWKRSPFAIIACAASKNSWYSWISPWLLEQSYDPRHFIPLGDPTTPRIIVGHNVSYDRSRTLEEYSLKSTKNRFLDTMALHVAVKGISSHQRPAWMKHRKSKEMAKERKAEAIEAVESLVDEIQDAEKEKNRAINSEKHEQLKQLRLAMEESLPQLQADDSEALDATAKRWEDITSANSLADVAMLHCGIEMNKEIREDFMTASRADIRDNIQDYLSYCANDASVTHAVFSKVLPDFLASCPHPVSFAGILTMGSSFLTVDESWEGYLESAERIYRNMEEKVKNRFLELAEEAKNMMQTEEWKNDLWLSQLDWTPKIAGKSRGVHPPDRPASTTTEGRPTWLETLISDGPLSLHSRRRILPLLLKLSFQRTPTDSHHLQYSNEHKWHYTRTLRNKSIPTYLPGGSKAKPVKCHHVLGKTRGLPLLNNGTIKSGVDHDLAAAIASGQDSSEVAGKVLTLAKLTAQKADSCEREKDLWLRQLDWTPITGDVSAVKKGKGQARTEIKPPPVLWPKWYWDLAKPKKNQPPGTIGITARSRIAPILLRLSWLGQPLFHSREHGWIFRVSAAESFSTRQSEISFHDPNDEHLRRAAQRGGYKFYKLPHKDGEKANVGNPLGKTFVPYAQAGTLRSPGDEAKEALELNTQCSYWTSARDRILNQLVVWQDEHLDLGFPAVEKKEKKFGMILPQVITMGAVTRRAIEKTWLTASNAKKDRVGSELKAMVRAPPGYAIVGADVDSEELWISSCMGDAQFGMHGATAVGWMTLEGTKAAGTDLHSKSANILGITRNQAKVFNYSRIYGAGVNHAVLLLLQSNAEMSSEGAQKLAESLYTATKGKNTHRSDFFGRKFWFGGTESFLFNKLEEIALSDRPQTPALGCGITYALSKEYLPSKFGSDYLPSRINWVVQSSGVDYLHLLIVSMDHLIQKYDIDARYLISVHDELRYLVAEKDRYRAALALQIANLWTRSLFALKLGMGDLPQGVAFFSAVDVDHVLRKEVDLPCVTPSQPIPIRAGEMLNIEQILSKTNGGSLRKDGLPMSTDNVDYWEGNLDGYQKPDWTAHRASSNEFLLAQASKDFNGVRYLAKKAARNASRSGDGPRAVGKR